MMPRDIEPNISRNTADKTSCVIIKAARLKIASNLIAIFKILIYNQLLPWYSFNQEEGMNSSSQRLMLAE